MNFNNKKYTYLIYLLSIYITLKILIFVLGDKITVYNNHYISVGSLLIPLWFFIGDILTELYGFSVAKKIIFIALSCQLIFALLCYSTIYLPVINNDEINSSYNVIFLKMPRLALSSIISLASGALLNYYFLDKWKKIVHGKYFLIRSLSTTIIGEILFSIVAITSQFLGKTSLNHIFELLSASILIKLTMTLVFSYPISILADYLKTSIAIPQDNLPHPLELIDKKL